MLWSGSVHWGSTSSQREWGNYLFDREDGLWDHKVVAAEVGLAKNKEIKEGLVWLLNEQHKTSKGDGTWRWMANRINRKSRQKQSNIFDVL